MIQIILRNFALDCVLYVSKDEIEMRELFTWQRIKVYCLSFRGGVPLEHEMNRSNLAVVYKPIISPKLNTCLTVYNFYISPK
jgi:hypothetical protein